MRDSIFLNKMDDWIFVPDGYYLLKDDDVLQQGDKFYHYASESWQSVTDYAGQRVSTFGSAGCRSKKKFKNVVTIE